MAVQLVERDHSYSRAPTGSFEHHRESQVFTDRSNWKLQTAMFDHIKKIFEAVQVDLFVERINAQKPKYVNWKPDPSVIAMDAFSLNWSQLTAYAFSPFCLI